MDARIWKALAAPAKEAKKRYNPMLGCIARSADPCRMTTTDGRILFRVFPPDLETGPGCPIDVQALHGLPAGNWSANGALESTDGRSIPIPEWDAPYPDVDSIIESAIGPTTASVTIKTKYLRMVADMAAASGHESVEFSFGTPRDAVVLRPREPESGSVGWMGIVMPVSPKRD